MCPQTHTGDLSLVEYTAKIRCSVLIKTFSTNDGTKIIIKILIEIYAVTLINILTFIDSSK